MHERTAGAPELLGSSTRSACMACGRCQANGVAGATRVECTEGSAAPRSRLAGLCMVASMSTTRGNGR